MSILSKFIKANQHYNLAISALEAQQYERALTEFNQTLCLNPHYTLAFINRGKLQQQHLSRFEAAAADYERALRLDPHDNQTRYRLAVLYETMGRYQKSAQHFHYIMMDVKWTKKNGAAKALQNFDNQQYQSAAHAMHRILSALDFH